MAKVKVMGSAVVIESAATVEQLETVQKYRPEVLTLKDADGEPTFMVSVKQGGTGSVGKYGAEFTKGSNGKATITVLETYEGESDEVLEQIADKYGNALQQLNRLEKLLGDELESVEAERDAIKRSITIQ